MQSHAPVQSSTGAEARLEAYVPAEETSAPPALSARLATRPSEVATDATTPEAALATDATAAETEIATDATAPEAEATMTDPRPQADGGAPVVTREPAESPKIRAGRLGLGSRRAGAELIRGTPRTEWRKELLRLGVSAPEAELVWPIDGGRFGRGLQWRGRRIWHRGVDITTKVGTPVRALADGIVGYADDGIPGYGNLMVVLHAGGEVSSYAHLSGYRAQVGEIVRAGDVIAVSGNTGISRGPHLHFEWREGGEEADPMPRFSIDVIPPWMARRRLARQEQESRLAAR